MFFTLFHAIVAVVALFLLVYIFSYVMTVVVRKQRSKEANNRALELAKRPIYLSTEGGASLIDENGNDVRFLNDERVRLRGMNYFMGSDIPAKAVQADFLNTMFADGSGWDIRVLPIYVTIIPANHAISEWAVVEVLPSKLKVSHPIMGELEIEQKDNVIYKVGDVLKLRQLVAMQNNAVLLKFEIC